MRITLIICCFILGTNFLFAQENDPVLFTVEDQEVRVSEFDYIYNKNNGDNANYSEESLREYLDLYLKFKLKVQRARDMKLDTIVSLQTELDGYRKQLAKSYLNDREVVEGLIKEIFERKKKDIRVSHVLIPTTDKDSPEQRQKALEEANNIRQTIIGGTPFERVAKLSSKDRNSSKNGGDIGFITSKLPDGFYEFETAIYNLTPGTISEPVPSKVGFHIIKVTEERQARGEIEVSHILIRKKNKGKVVSTAKELVDSLYNEITNGADFGKVVKEYSQDLSSVNKGGYVGFFGINRFEKSFEEAAFGLENDGDVSAPIETAVGYHIIKRLSKANQNDYESMKKKIQKSVQKDSRLEFAKKAMIQKIKQEAEYKENTAVLDDFKSKVGEDFYSYKWQVPPLTKSTIISFDGDLEFSNIDFANYCKRNARKRMRFDKSTALENSVISLFNEYVDEKCTIYEEKNLEKKYPEFKALMREYQEGILLFEATKMKVWDKASKDTVGLEKYFAEHRDDFKWSERAVLSKYTLNTSNPKTIKKVRKCASKESSEELFARFNKTEEIVSVERVIMDRDDQGSNLFNWKVGSVSESILNEDKATTSFYKVSEIKPSKLKTMDEARGYIIADYQDFLEDKWVSELRDTYSINIDEKIFTSLVKK